MRTVHKNKAEALAYEKEHHHLASRRRKPSADLNRMRSCARGGIAPSAADERIQKEIRIV